MARTTTRRRTTASTQLQATAQNAASTWAKFTWLTDTERTPARVPHVAVNWLATLGLTWAWVKFYMHWQPLAAVTVAALIYSMVRARRHIPARTKTVAGLYASTARSCGHPTLSRTAAVGPESRVKVTRWGKPGQALDGLITYTATAPAGEPSTRRQLEAALESVVVGDGTEVVFDWETTPGILAFRSVPHDDIQVARKKTRRWVETATANLFPAKRGQAPAYATVQWPDGDGADVLDPKVPAAITITFGAYDVTAPGFRDKTEEGFDRQVSPPGIDWTYEWATGMVTAVASPVDHPEVARKLLARKITAVVTGAVTRSAGATAGKAASAQVTGWVAQDAPNAPNTPKEITVDLGVTDMSSPLTQQTLLSEIDRALEAEWADRVWIATWQGGATTTLLLRAYPSGHGLALRKAETTRLREVVRKSFPIKRGQAPSDITVQEWTALARDGRSVQAAHTANITFGTADVTDPETRRDFESHFDSQTDSNDWRYEWNTARGEVVVTAVPTLPRYLPFPEEGTPECDAWHQRFRAGEILIGPAKGGYEVVIQLDSVPHTMVGGATGGGKSTLLTIILYGVLMNHDVVEIIVIDPKVTDFTWTPGYPNVRYYAVSDVRRSAEQIKEAVTIAYDEMMERQALLREHGVKELRVLRRTIADGTNTRLTLDQVPKRLIVFFDEGGAAFTLSKNPEIRALQEESRTMMEQISMLGRAMEVNVILAAQKPSAENIGTAIRDQLGNKFAVGKLNPATSIQVLGNTLATLLDGAPKGRGYMVNEKGQELEFQTPYLPDMDTADPLDPAITLRGVRERVADRLGSLGWAPVVVMDTFTREQKDGSTVTVEEPITRWVRPDRMQQP